MDFENQKSQFSKALHQTILQGIKKSSKDGYWDVKSYWISYASLWNSITVIMLVDIMEPY